MSFLSDHLGIQQLGERPPARLRHGAFVLAPLGLHPVPIVGQQGRHILAEAIGEKQWGAVGSQHLRHVVDHALGHRECAIADVDGQQQFALRVHRSPDPLG